MRLLVNIEIQHYFQAEQRPGPGGRRGKGSAVMKSLGGGGAAEEAEAAAERAAAFVRK